MLISGIQKFTVLDYPGKTACIVFTPGCQFRCGYCHNPEFVLPERIQELKGSFIPEAALFNFLETRRGLLDGVVVTGGEPTMMPDLVAFMTRLKRLGFAVKLDTNGNRPVVVEQAIKVGAVDYIAMDVKTSLLEYPNLAGKLVSPDNIAASIQKIMRSKLPYEFRSTLIKEVHSPDIIADMKTLVAGAKRLYLQTFRPGQTLSPIFGSYHPFSSEEIKEIADGFREVVGEVAIR